MIKVHFTRPMISLVDFADDDQPNIESGRLIFREMRGIVQRWNLAPIVERNSKGTVDKQNQTPFWCAYRNVFISNKFHPEDLEVLQQELDTGLTSAIKDKLKAIRCLEEQSKSDPDMDHGQAGRLIYFLNEVINHIRSDQTYLMDMLRDLLIQLEPEGYLWENNDAV